TPNANYNGTVPVATYTMSDGSSGDTSTLAITVTAVDDSFTDEDRTSTRLNSSHAKTSYAVSCTRKVDGAVTVTSFLIAGDATVPTAVSTTTMRAAGTPLFPYTTLFRSTPNANYNGTVPVATYTMSDGSSGDTSTLAITVTAVDDSFTD